ncbi:ribonuclease III [Schaalia sp. Marseille-Q2122]|uniref:ribonuclease III n=1 Tax=Schaalia sp. Marseille-Q2122 TaxID=2736604 RepID=UPI00158A7187|nr:ribonuclease III [Schaalia sp. Marseille-Q2122]
MAKRSKLPQPPAEDLNALMEVWGADLPEELLRLALTHRSYANEAGGLPNNERLEFLGDSVLSIVIAERLFHDYPKCSESELSRMRAATVSQTPLAQAARTLGLGDYIFLGKGEHLSGGRTKASILSDTFEALLGATYLTHGFEVAQRVILTHLAPMLDQAFVRGQTQDWKTSLIEYARSQGWGDVSYVVTGDGPDHMRTFTAQVFIEGCEGVQGMALDTSKKHAENLAARAALLALEPDFIRPE